MRCSLLVEIAVLADQDEPWLILSHQTRERGREGGREEEGGREGGRRKRGREEGEREGEIKQK